jgi:hypothetical protein
MSLVKDGKRATSWFSKNDPYKLRSVALLRRVFNPETSSLIRPFEDWKARKIQ